eukprot:scaffold220880_cov18-Prasinocladus_malaysianus.AAC.1
MRSDCSYAWRRDYHGPGQHAIEVSLLDGEPVIPLASMEKLAMGFLPDWTRRSCEYNPNLP